MNGPDYYLPAAATGFALALKVPALVRNWRDPLLRSVTALLALGTSVFFFSAPPTIVRVNRLTSVPNISAPLVYVLLSAFSASCLVLMVNWRGGPAEATRRTSRLWISGYAAVSLALIALFALGDAPVERLRDLDTYYANTPYIREMIVLYLTGLTVAGVAMAWLCLRWSLQVRGLLRAGLICIATGYLFNLSYATAKFTAVFACWAGRTDLDGLSTDTAPLLASVAAGFTAVGFCLPLAFQRLTDRLEIWSTYRRLGPLWHELRGLGPHGGHTPRLVWWPSAELLVIQRESDIHDGMLCLYPYFDGRVRAGAYAAAVRDGSGPDQAHAVADAVMVTAAVRARAADPEGTALDRDAAAPPAALSGEGPRDLVRMSLALRHSPVVAAARTADCPSAG
ncbi:MAB_1171c family putative transporter [Streptomyces sp. NPDC059816]|uniref:MAB_1171c family putative transporter n=1 Tax=Streptomyces sp. NPDC059816 TaxID=3346960 RepID=UPI00365F6994